MSNPDLQHLFTPGTGVVPPYLAGRKKEREYFQDCVEALTDRKPISRDMIVYGPRGNGKTALLGYLQKETLREEGSKLDILWETPSEMRTLTELSGRLTEDNQKLRERFRSVEVSGGLGFARTRTAIDLSRSSTTIRKILQERSQNKPFVLIIDEAHRLEPPVAEALLNASQAVRREGIAFLLILAGTPNLEAEFGRANASFWDRSELFPLGRLSPEEAGQAIIVPLQEAGVSCAPGVGEEIVERTHCYPFFLQVWGDCLARRVYQTGARIISADTIREVEVTATRKRDSMYQIRFNEINRMGLLDVAASVAGAFIRSREPVLHGSILKEAIITGMAGDDEPVTNDRIMEKFEQLLYLGYVWQNDLTEYAYEAGIPSLMSRVHSNSPGQPPAETVSLSGEARNEIAGARKLPHGIRGTVSNTGE